MSAIAVDLYSDTLTRPTAAMRRAMAEAEVGDEQNREDPTVNRLQADGRRAPGPRGGALHAIRHDVQPGRLRGALPGR